MLRSSLGLVAAGALLFAGCGGDDSNLDYPPFPISPGDPDAGPRPDGSPPPPPPVAEPVINEVVVDGVTDFIEVHGEPNTDYSGLRILVVEGDNAPPGPIDLVITPGMTDANGFWFDDTVAIETGSNTFLLVSNFSGAVTDDVDTDDDGVIDNVLWDEILDSVALDDNVNTNFFYAESVVLRDDTADIAAGAARRADGVDTDVSGDWVPVAFDGTADDDTQANATPGATNTCNTPAAACP